MLVCLHAVSPCMTSTFLMRVQLKQILKQIPSVGRRLSDIRDCKKQSVPAGGVAPLLNALPHLKDLTLYMHKPPEVR